MKDTVVRPEAVAISVIRGLRMTRMMIVTVLIALSSAGCSEKDSTVPPDQTKAQEVIRVDERWAQAVIEGDTDFMTQLLADEYVNTAPSGEIKDKSEYLIDFTSGVRQVSSLTISDDSQVQIYGDVAIVMHGGTAQGTYGGKNVGGSYRWTHVFVQRDGRWQCTSNHATRIAQ